MDITQIKEIVANVLSVEVSDVTSDKKLIEDLNADSLKLVQILMAVEDAFLIEIDEEDISEIKTFADIEKLVHKYSK